LQKLTKHKYNQIYGVPANHFPPCLGLTSRANSPTQQEKLVQSGIKIGFSATCQHLATGQQKKKSSTPTTVFSPGWSGSKILDLWNKERQLGIPYRQTDKGIY